MRGLTRLSVHPIEAAAHVAELSGVDVVHLERDDPDLLIPAPVASGTRYPAPAGDPHIRARLAAHYSALSHRTISAAQVVLVPGVNLVLHFALLALTGTGDEVLVPNPGSPSYAELARIAGATPVGYPLHAEAGFLPDVDEITSLITSRTRVLVLNSPHNPTGTLLPESLLTRLFEVANDRRLYVVVDEAHRELTGGVSALTAAAVHDRTIVMNTVSGRHAGAAVVPRHLADDMAVRLADGLARIGVFLDGLR